MSFEPLETEYGKKRKRSDHRLRQVSSKEKGEKERKHPMEGYEAAEEELKEKKEPEEQVLFKGKRNRFSAGYNRDCRLTMVFSRDKNDGEIKEEENFQKERSGTWNQNKKYFRASTGRPEKGAMTLEDREERQKKFLMKQTADAVEAPEENLLQREFEFLSTKEERMQIRALEDDARKNSLDRNRVEEDRRQAAVLERDRLHKEEEKREFMKKVSSQVTKEKAQKKQKKQDDLSGRFLHEIRFQEEADEENENGTGEENKEKNPPVHEKTETAEEISEGKL